MKLIEIKKMNLPKWKCCGCIALTDSLENSVLPKKNDNIMMAWKPMLIINAISAILFNERYSGAVILFIT